MPFNLNSTIDRFDSQVTLSGTTAQVLSDAYSVTSDIVLFNHTTETPYLVVVFQSQFLSSPNLGSSVTLYARPANLPPTGQNSPVPDANFDYYKVARIPVDSSTALQSSLVIIKLDQHELNGQFRFYIKNETDQTIPLGWKLLGTPQSTGPTPVSTIATDTQLFEPDVFTEATNGGGTLAVLSGAFSAPADTITLSNADNSVDFSVTFRCTYTSAPNTNSEIRLYCRKRAINGVSNSPPPSLVYKGQLVGIFPVVDITSVQLITIPVHCKPTLSQQDHEWWIENRSGSDIPAGWQIWQTPITTRPQ